MLDAMLPRSDVSCPSSCFIDAAIRSLDCAMSCTVCEPNVFDVVERLSRIVSIDLLA